MNKQAFPHSIDDNDRPIDLYLERYPQEDRASLINDLVSGKTITIPQELKEGKIVSYIQVNNHDFDSDKHQLDYFEKIMNQMEAESSNELLYDRSKRKAFENMSL